MRFLPHRHAISEADLSAFVDGALPAARRGHVEAHLRGCDRCAALLAEVRSVKALSAALPRRAAPRSFAFSPALAAKAEARPTAGRAWPRYALAPAAALAALVVLLGADFVVFPAGRDDAISREAAAPAPAKSLASQAESGAAAPASGTGAAAPPALAPAVPTPAGRAAADAAQPAAPPSPFEAPRGPVAPTAQERGIDGGAAGRADNRALLRALEGAALAALAASLGYAVWRKRRESN